MRLVEIRLCFTSNRFDGKSAIELLGRENLLGFSPTRLSINGLEESIHRAKYVDNLKEIENIGKGLNIELETDEEFGPQFRIIKAGRSEAGQVLAWILPYDSFLSIDFEFLLIDPAFVCGFCFDHDFVFWEDTLDIGTYKFFKKPYEHLPKVRDELDRLVIDISKNPGRSVLLPNIWLQSAWRMYFGIKFFELVPKERIMGFKGAEKNKILGNGVIFIELFEDVFESDKDENKTRLQAFRDWIDMDGLEEKIGTAYKEKVKDSSTVNNNDHLGFKELDISLMKDIKKQSEWLIKAFGADGLKLDHSLKSLIEIDRFFEIHSKNGKAIEGGRLSENLGARLFSIASYIGETLIKNSPGSIWATDDDDSNDEMNMAIVLKGGMVCWPMKKVMKRFTNGLEDGIYPYAYELTKEFVSEAFDGTYWKLSESQKKKRPFWKFW